MKVRKSSGRQRLAFLMAVGAAGLVLSSCGAKKQDPVTITVWNYYNGDQQMAFDEMVKTFNETIGNEQGIIVQSVSQGSINGLADELLNSVQGKAGAKDVPNLAAVYPEIAYMLGKDDKLADLDQYLSADELKTYVPGFLEEGRMTPGGPLVLFPISKSTELFMYNQTDCDVFEQATGVKVGEITTMEDMAKAAEAYYKWTDDQTPDVPEDGKALYGRDAVANYIMSGTVALGHEPFPIVDGKVAVDLDRDTFKTLWDDYYIPYINGYFGSYANYRADDMKTGQLLAMTCSSSSASFFPTVVTLPDDTSHEIQMGLSKQLGFEKQTEPVYVQQGAGYCVLKADDRADKASVEFLKWFTEEEQNLTFAASAGYSPAKISANDPEKIKASFGDVSGNAKSENMMKSLLTCADVMQNCRTYAAKPYGGSKAVRSALEDCFTNAFTNDRAAVVAKIQSGMSREEATAEFSTDAYFDAWFQDMCSQVEGLIQQ